MGEAEFEAEYDRLMKLARQRSLDGILSPEDYRARKKAPRRNAGGMDTQTRVRRKSPSGPVAR